MRICGPSNEDEMVLAFLRAEFHSPRFKAMIRKALDGNADLVYRPRLDDPRENAARKRALAAIRGFGANTYLFRDFPNDVRWLRVTCTVEELGAVKYANYPTWITLSAGSRLVRDGAANIETIRTTEDINPSVKALERAIAGGQAYPELILAAETEDSVPVVVEGHTRATAYVRTLPATAEIEAILALSPRLSEWAFF